MATFDDFQRSLDAAEPPADFEPPLRGLWFAAKGEWEAAHESVREVETAAAAWVHAHLHRVEGDLDNARYWYGQAGRPATSAPLDVERTAIVRSLTGAEP